MAKLRGELAVAKDAAKFDKSKAGKIGGPARAAAVSPERRKEIAVKAALARWNRLTPEERTAEAMKGVAGRKPRDSAV
jgi:hypothetical protein